MDDQSDGGEDGDERPYQARNAEQYSDGEFVTAIQSEDLITTAEVAELVGCSLDTALRRLQSLEENDECESKQVGRSYVWHCS